MRIIRCFGCGMRLGEMREDAVVYGFILCKECESRALTGGVDE